MFHAGGGEIAVNNICVRPLPCGCTSLSRVLISVRKLSLSACVQRPRLPFIGEGSSAVIIC